MLVVKGVPNDVPVSLRSLGLSSFCLRRRFVVRGSAVIARLRVTQLPKNSKIGVCSHNKFLPALKFFWFCTHSWVNKLNNHSGAIMVYTIQNTKQTSTDVSDDFIQFDDAMYNKHCVNFVTNTAFLHTIVKATTFTTVFAKLPCATASTYRRPRRLTSDRIDLPATASTYQRPRRLTTSLYFFQKPKLFNIIQQIHKIRFLFI